MFADRVAGHDHAVLCEGPLDALKAHYCGGNVATMGKAVAPAQIQLLKSSGIKKLYLALDPDAAEEVNRLVESLSGHLELYDMIAPTNGTKADLGAMSLEEVYDLFLSAPKINPSNFFMFLKTH